jgi:hypothetical protein
MKTTTEPPTKPNLITRIAAFVTTDELKQLEGFENELRNFDEQISFTVILSAEKRRDSALQTYVGTPNFKNFTAFRQALIDEALIEKILPSSLRAVVEHARDNFIKTNVAPWAQSILERALAKARQRLEEITVEESRRYKELTGETFGHSGIVEAARRPVMQLEKLLAAASKPETYVSSIFPYLRKLAIP